MSDARILHKKASGGERACSLAGTDYLREMLAKFTREEGVVDAESRLLKG